MTALELRVIGEVSEVPEVSCDSKDEDGMKRKRKEILFRPYVYPGKTRSGSFMKVLFCISRH
jgi:hypothetical protein